MKNSTCMSSFEYFYRYSENIAKKWNLESSSDERLPAILASDRNTPQIFLALLAQSNDLDIISRLASNPNTPDDILLQFVDHPEKCVRLALANNNLAPNIVGELLANDWSVDVRYTVASNPNISNHALRALKEDSNPYVVIRAEKTLKRLETLNEKSCVLAQSKTMIRKQKRKPQLSTV